MKMGDDTSRGKTEKGREITLNKKNEKGMTMKKYLTRSHDSIIIKRNPRHVNITTATLCGRIKQQTIPAYS